ncbi:MAG: hypothetical protein HRU09_10935 [Oligoflexales bacterium]|nr:hypothetical protein [Oligoflexales bacterium]
MNSRKEVYYCYKIEGAFNISRLIGDFTAYPDEALDVCKGMGGNKIDQF